VLDFVAECVKPGVTTGELDRLCHDLIVEEQKAIPAPLNYARPATSPSQVDLHLGQPPGVPRHSGERVLKGGDILNIDVT